MQLKSATHSARVVLDLPVSPSESTREISVDRALRTASAELSPSTVRKARPASATRVAAWMRDSLSQELFENFELFLYVSKASAGPWAQHLYVFSKAPRRTLHLLYDWPVSTGREKIEYNKAGALLPTFTPAGYFQIDPDRFYEHYSSRQWGERMPYAMFLNWTDRGGKTGVAIHAASGNEIYRLGRRASAGCIRLAPANARTLFALIRSRYRGAVPKFAVNGRTDTTSRTGAFARGEGGHLEFTNGYRVLVFVEDYGGQNLVAAVF